MLLTSPFGGYRYFILLPKHGEQIADLWQFFWTLLILALTGNMIHDALGGNPPTVNFVMFVAVFAMLSLIYLIAAAVNEGFAMFAWGPLLVDGLNVFTFVIAGIVMAAQLGVRNCSDEVSPSALQCSRC